MANWTRQQPQQQGGGYFPGIEGPRSSHNWKPPLDNSQTSVPSWEKKFCSSVGLIPWHKILETKKFMYLYENVVKWDDSAGREAFENAKSRYWADINGRRSNIPLPDPNMYTDDIDWDSNVDPELLLDLEKETGTPKDENVVILGDALQFNNQSFSCTGWGDTEVNKDENAVMLGDSPQLNQSVCCTGWGDAEWDMPKTTNFYPDPTNTGVNSWGQHYPQEYEWKNGWNDSWDSWDSWNHNQKQHYGNQWQNDDRRNDGYWATYDRHDRGRGNPASHNMSRFKTSRFHNGNDNQMRGGWRNGRGRKRENFVHDRQYMNNLPAAS
ncbi:Bifunctional endo-1,4-beta-xylanase [Quillaja saponaria]|uniref:Bifunctional endo-1,4-beta-xylanase n=1 Tax=Quillaja saponaria TaxID=32244 RepID=A0AAD7VIF9_QUISA|nr:Bifunctional endo-1,4-beta-xylanase [Quillaja saponaria]